MQLQLAKFISNPHNLSIVGSDVGYNLLADEVLLSRANSKASVSFNREQSDDEILNILLSFQNRG